MRDDVAKADDAQRLAGQLDSDQLAVKFTVVQLLVRLRDVARQREHQGQRMLGRRDGVAARRDQHGDALCGRSLGVDVVKAGAGAAYDFQFRRLVDDVGGEARKPEVRHRLDGDQHDDEDDEVPVRA